MPKMTLNCADFGVACPVVFRGESVAELLDQAKAHGMEAHGQTKEQVESEEVMKTAAAKVRHE